MCENPVTRVHKGLPEGYVLQRGPGPEYRWYAMRIAPTEYCLPDPDRPGTYLSFATVEEGLAWFAAEFATDYETYQDGGRQHAGRSQAGVAP